MDDLNCKLLDKAKEAFTMAIEIYNKPTIKYRVEGFAMFICNAWELMLKAYIIKTKGEKDIYHKDHPDRTISLENCIKNIFTNSKDPLRLNLEKIIELRNTSTHFITEEYEMVYIPLFQACIFNFNEKMMAFHDFDMATIIPQNFLTLSVSMKALDESEIIAKYPEEIAQKVLKLKDSVDDLSVNNNDKFAIRINHYHFLTKNRNEATTFVNISKDSDSDVKIIKELKDPNNTHNFTTKSCIEIIQKMITKAGIQLKYNGKDARFTSFHFHNFCYYFGLKSNEKYCYVHKQFRTLQYTYSQQMIDFIVEEIAKDTDHILDNIKK